MQRPNPKHTNACEFARLSLAVWRAAPEKHHTFDDWLFASVEPPETADAQKYAAELVGPAELDKAMADPWVDQKLQLSIAIYETAARAGQGNMPQLHIGANVAVGTLAMSDLLQLLGNNLGLHAPPTP